MVRLEAVEGEYIVEYSNPLKEAVITFTDACFRELGKAFEPEGRHSFYHDIDKEFDSFWCLLSNDKVIGTVGVKKLDESTAELKALYLQSEFRGKGFGFRLLDKAVQFAKEQGYQRIVLDSMSQYDDAIRLYEKFGFKFTERYNDNPYADVFMEYKFCGVLKEFIIKDTFEEYLSVSKYINWDADCILSKAVVFQQKYPDEITLIRAVYEFVRDDIKHSWDVQDKRVTKSATEVLEQGVGICWAKANLLAALLRACGIPTGICYQRLTLGDVPETGFCIHALNAVYVKSLDRWIRLDARGNKEGIDARFDLEQERLAFPVRKDIGEEDYGVVYANPAAGLMQVLEENTDALYMYLNCLPDSILD